MDDMNLTQMVALDAFKQLRERQRVVVALRVAGYSQKESGAIVGLTRGAIGYIYKQSLSDLRKILLKGVQI